MGLDGMVEVGDRANEGQSVGVYGTCFATEFLAEIGAKDRWEGEVENQGLFWWGVDGG